MTDKEKMEFRADLVRKVKAGQITLADAQDQAMRLAPLEPPRSYSGFAGMTESEMCSKRVEDQSW